MSHTVPTQCLRHVFLTPCIMAFLTFNPFRKLRQITITSLLLNKNILYKNQLESDLDVHEALAKLTFTGTI